MAAMINPNGSIRLPFAIWPLLLAIFLAASGGLAFVVRLDAKIESMSNERRQDHVLLLQHVALPGHPVALERTKVLTEKVDKLEKRKP